MKVNFAKLILVVSVALTPLCAQPKKAAHEVRAEKTAFGTLSDGKTVDLFTLTNARGTVAKVIAYGATLTELWIPDRHGKNDDVVLGFDDLSGYVKNPAWFGATVGRVTNRIAKGKFTLGGKQYSLEINNPPNSLHSGPNDLSHVVWKGEVISSSHAAVVKFSYLSPDGDEGFPGNLTVSVTYTLTDSNELKLDYSAKTDQPTPVNLTNHSYFNLGGGKDVLSDVLYLNADRYTPVDATFIPTGEILPVKGTPLDFTHPTPIGARISEIKGDPGGYDQNFVLNGEPGKLKLAARVTDPGSGRKLEMWTTEPGVQFYSANFLDGTIVGKGGMKYEKHAAFCLEAQHFPDAVNQPKFPSIILDPGGTYRQETVYKFSVE